jgi:hypothetical protein
MECRQRVFLACCVLQITAGNMSFALISPFFPLEAPKLGLSTQDVAIVLGALTCA